MVLELHFYFIYLEAWWQDKLYHTHQYRIYKTSEQHKISYHNPRSPMPLSLGISMYNVDTRIHVFQHCNIQIFSVHTGDWFFLLNDLLADTNAEFVARSSVTLLLSINMVISLEISVLVLRNMYEMERNPSSCYENS